MPELISVLEFVNETNEDLNSPTTSNFVVKMGACRNVVTQLEETLDSDRSGLGKMRKSVKNIYNTGNTYVGNLLSFAENLEKLGSTTLSKEKEPDLGAAFLKFSVITKELAALLKHLVQNINNIVMFPLDSLLKGDLKGQKGDMKKPFEKAWKDYESKYTKIEREKKQLAKEAGLIRTTISGPEVAEEMEKERRMFQLHMCEYLIKVNDIKSKKGAELVQHLVEYYRVENSFYRDGLKTIEHFQSYIDELAENVHKIKMRHDEEKKKLMDLRNLLKTSLSLDKETPPEKQGYSLHQLQTDKALGTEKTGFLHKRTEGLRKVYQKRRCEIRDGYLCIAHSTVSKAPVRMNLLTCQVKPSLEEQSKKYFDLVARDRTYHFMAETEEEAAEWISVLNNSKKYALDAVFDDSSSPSDIPNKGLQELTQGIVRQVRRLPANDICCDCSAPDPQWLSTNLGILTCIECSGVHRQLGVHISRVQSLELDRLGTAQLLIAMTVGNTTFNQVFEASLEPSNKPVPNSTMDERKEFIFAKYERRKYVLKTSSSPSVMLQDLRQAVVLSDMDQLLRVFAEGVDLAAPVSDTYNNETALHLAIRQQDDTNLHIVDFLIQNLSRMDQCNHNGDTPLHLAARLNKVDCVKILLRGGGKPTAENTIGETSLDIVARNGYGQCEELMRQAMSGKLLQCEHVDFDWGLSSDNEDGADFSEEDELDEREKPPRNSRQQSPARRNVVRPQTLVQSPSGTFPTKLSRERPLSEKADGRRMRSSTDSIVMDRPVLERPSMPPPPVPPRKVGSVSMKKKAPNPPHMTHKRNSSDPAFINSPPPTPPARITSIRESPKGIPGSGKAGMVSPTRPSSTTMDAMRQLLTERPNLVLKNRPPSTEGPPPVPSKKKLSTASIESNSDGNSRPISTTSYYTAHSGQSDSRPNSQSNSRPGSGRSSTSGLEDEKGMGDAPTPAPRVHRTSTSKGLRRVRALYDCHADYEDELEFEEGEIIVVTGEADSEWWIGEVEGMPERRGVFPVNFVEISDG
ncbi:arf-GAP with SH3 domain, ANK repeat and PH domain-containing protein 1-like isoform X3 [Acanthaster planci]|uniref:Arf-GAP with SH3 domain, ANK repeat and PH domain-containing protein 1-like isoform X3 n=1 Tax=Acanthaster planci TaxID=133434 RepID=A0A8B7Z730_ACAPL|nr:arf-GAP with SH3 domain, ANK repeat and PH domain-containing protein 1-like isoform X3 [Acanthaster planci]